MHTDRPHLQPLSTKSQTAQGSRAGTKRSYNLSTFQNSVQKSTQESNRTQKSRNQVARENNKDFKIQQSGNQGSLFGQPPPNTSSIDTSRPENGQLVEKTPFNQRNKSVTIAENRPAPI